MSGPPMIPTRVEGLATFSRNLRRMDPELPKGLRLAANEAADMVVQEARPRVPLGPGKRGHARSSLRAASTRTSARVRAGGKKFPYYGWLDFGGTRVGRGGGTASRPFIKKGRYIWAAFADKREQVDRKLLDSLTDVARKAGLEPRA